MQNGLSPDHIKSFGRTARKMLIKSLDDVECDYRPEEAEMAEIFSTWEPQRRLLHSTEAVLTSNA
jgi:hypothetical protein